MTLWYPEKGKNGRTNTKRESFLAYSAERYLSPELKDRIVQITILLDEIYSEVESSQYALLSSSVLSKIRNYDSLEDYLTDLRLLITEWDSDKIFYHTI